MGFSGMNKKTRPVAALLALMAVLLYDAHGWGQRTVEFQMLAPGASTVMLYGGFNGWSQGHLLQKNGNGLWRYSMKLGRGRYEYKFLVDGKWRYNTALPTIADGFGDKNNLVIVR